jgi:hypothetical protein
MGENLKRSSKKLPVGKKLQHEATVAARRGGYSSRLRPSASEKTNKTN